MINVMKSINVQLGIVIGILWNVLFTRYMWDGRKNERRICIRRISL